MTSESVLISFFLLMIRRPPRSTLERSSAASDVYKRQVLAAALGCSKSVSPAGFWYGLWEKLLGEPPEQDSAMDVRLLDTFACSVVRTCLLYTSDAADERSSVDLGGRRIIKKKKTKNTDRAGLSTNKKTELCTQNKHKCIKSTKSKISDNRDNV